MPDIIWELCGYFAGICTAVTFLPQAVKTIKSKDISGLSLGTYIIYCSGITAWIFYGLYLHSIQMILFNSISLILGLIILYLIISCPKE